MNANFTALATKSIAKTRVLKSAVAGGDDLLQRIARIVRETISQHIELRHLVAEILMNGRLAGADMISPSPKSPVCRNTLNVAVATPTESGDLSCPEFCNAAPRRIHGYGLGAVVRKAIGVTTFTLRTPSPPGACRNAPSGFSVHVGTETMKPTSKPGALPATTHTQAGLILKASNNLAAALRALHTDTDGDGIKRATGRAVAAARALKRIAELGGSVQSRRGPLIATTSDDKRVARVFRTDECAIAGDMDGDTFLVIGKDCPADKLQKLIERERIDLQALEVQA